MVAVTRLSLKRWLPSAKDGSTRPLRFSTWLLILLAILLSAACSRLPDYAQPRFADAAGSPQDNALGFGYRQLTVVDFQAQTLPDSFSEHKHRIQARSCISLRSSQNTVARISLGEVEGQPLFLGRFQHILFEAAFNPTCSWWNPSMGSEQVGYVLQHEQIHFALTELTARRLNLERRGELEAFLAIGNSADEVTTQLAERVRQLSREAMARDIVVHTEFDQETSLQYDPVVQQRWYQDVTLQLRKTALSLDSPETAGTTSVAQP